MMDSLGGFDFLDSNAGDGANTGALVTANAVFGKKMQAIVAIFGEGGFFMGVRKGYTARSRACPLINSRRAPAKSSPKVF
jgi:hypothetical protein